jgi:hypothetical protein
MYLVSAVHCQTIGVDGSPSLAVARIDPSLLDLLHRVRLWLLDGKGIIGDAGWYCIPRPHAAAWSWFTTARAEDVWIWRSALFSNKYPRHLFAINGPDYGVIEVDEPAGIKVLELDTISEIPNPRIELMLDRANGGKVKFRVAASTRYVAEAYTNYMEVDELFEDHELVEIDWRHLKGRKPF